MHRTIRLAPHGRCRAKDPSPAACHKERLAGVRCARKPASSATQTDPSGASAIPWGSAPGWKLICSTRRPSRSSRTTELAAHNVAQQPPSAVAATACGRQERSGKREFLDPPVRADAPDLAGADLGEPYNLAARVDADWGRIRRRQRVDGGGAVRGDPGDGANPVEGAPQRAIRGRP